MEIYPNPVLSSKKIFISSSPKIKGIFTWDMSDFSGRIVKRGLWNSSAEDQNLTIETIGMKPGIYCISLTCAENGILLRKKVLVLK
ncbi:MAG: T9SS type A sorting domain-containing protein [Bacteroidetes bacterium]|nr:T9SS type A sorting domain-containing protein [Bacteroidota bacterium]